MFDDLSNVEVALATGGTLTAASLLFLFMQVLKAFFPGLHGRAALTTVYFLAGLIAAWVVAEAGFTFALPWVGTFVVTMFSLGLLAESIYARVYGRTLRIEDMALGELEELLRKVGQEYNQRILAASEQDE